MSSGDISFQQPDGPIYLAVEHEHVRAIEREVFTVSFVGDCMTHSCRCLDERPQVVKADACCQHGADVLIPEKLAILRRADEIASVLKPERRLPGTWFDERDPEIDPEAPLGIIIRTATSDLHDEASGCVFLQHVGERGCGLHVAALAHGFDPAEIKPAVCRIYPLSFSAGKLGFSDDFDRYSCARSGSASVYRVMRPTLLEVFGDGLVQTLDELELKQTARRLTVVD